MEVLAVGAAVGLAAYFGSRKEPQMRPSVVDRLPETKVEEPTLAYPDVNTTNWYAPEPNQRREVIDSQSFDRTLENWGATPRKYRYDDQLAKAPLWQPQKQFKVDFSAARENYSGILSKGQHHNNVSPVTQTRVGPGVGFDPSVQAAGGLHWGGTRVMPLQNDEQRINQLQVPIRGTQKEISQPTPYPNATKNRPETYYEVSDDFNFGAMGFGAALGATDRPDFDLRACNLNREQTTGFAAGPAIGGLGLGDRDQIHTDDPKKACETPIWSGPSGAQSAAPRRRDDEYIWKPEDREDTVCSLSDRRQAQTLTATGPQGQMYRHNFTQLPPQRAGAGALPTMGVGSGRGPLWYNKEATEPTKMDQTQFSFSGNPTRDEGVRLRNMEAPDPTKYDMATFSRVGGSKFAGSDTVGLPQTFDLDSLKDVGTVQDYVANGGKQMIRLDPNDEINQTVLGEEVDGHRVSISPAFLQNLQVLPANMITAKEPPAEGRHLEDLYITQAIEVASS